MKVETKETDFSPVTITLETKEEASFMWHLFNMDTDITKSDYFKNNNSEEVLRKLDSVFYQQFNNVYKNDEL